MGKRIYKDEATSKKAKERRINAYNREKKTAYLLRYNNEYDKEIIEKLNSVENRNDYIRQLILADIKKNG